MTCNFWKIKIARKSSSVPWKQRNPHILFHPIIEWNENFFKTFLSTSVFFWDPTYAVVLVVWADTCVWTIHLLPGSASALQTGLPRLSSFLGKVEGKWRLLSRHSAKFLQACSMLCVAQWSEVMHCGRQAAVEQKSYHGLEKPSQQHCQWH